MALYIITGIIIIAGTAVMLFLRQPGFGRLPSGERLERIKQSPHYHDGAFRNLQPTELMTSEKGRLRVMWNFLFNKPEGIYPDNPVPAIKTDLRELPANSDWMV